LVNQIENYVSANEFRERYREFLASYPGDTLSTLLNDNYNYTLNTSKSLERQGYYNETLLDANKKMISWRDILKKNAGKVIYIDFWARWCLPCVQEIPVSFSLEKELNSKDIVFIYVSEDVGEITWLNALSEFHFKNLDNVYLITLPAQSRILKYYSVMTIPHYLLFNKKGDLVFKNAPRPSSQEIKQLLLKFIKE
jgi:thiol-disulfide isomerase/thioredoxin